MSPSEPWVPLGQVLKEWGLAGELKCLAFNPESELFAQVSKLYLGDGDEFVNYELERARRHGEHWRLKFRGVDDPERAQALRGAKLALPRSELPEVETGQIYVADLLNCDVLDPEGKILGQVHRIQEVGESQILWIRSSQGQETPVPYESDFIAKTDLQDKHLYLTKMALELFQMNLS